MLAVRKPVSCSTKGCVQLVLQNRNHSSPPKLPTGAEFDQQFSLFQLRAGYSTSGVFSEHFTMARNSNLNEKDRYDYPLLRTAICVSATLYVLLPHTLPSSFIQHKQF